MKKYFMNQKDVKFYDDDPEWPYSFKVDLWGKQKEVQVEVLDLDIDDSFLDLIFPIIKEKISFINEQRFEIEKALIEDDTVQLANDWAESAESVEDEDNCYIMEDGQKVYLPITEEDFKKNIYIDEAEIMVEDSLDNVSIHFFIKYNPDIFAGHALELYIDKDNKIECIGLAG